MGTMKIFASLLVLISLVLGCAPKRPIVYQFNTCAITKERVVCECTKWHKSINAKNGENVITCE